MEESGMELRSSLAVFRGAASIHFLSPVRGSMPALVTMQVLPALELCRNTMRHLPPIAPGGRHAYLVRYWVYVVVVILSESLRRFVIL